MLIFFSVSHPEGLEGGREGEREGEREGRERQGSRNRRGDFHQSAFTLTQGVVYTCTCIYIHRKQREQEEGVEG